MSKVKEIKSEIVSNNFRNAIKLIRTVKDDEVIQQIEGRLKELERSEIMGILSRDRILRERNILRVDLITIANSLSRNQEAISNVNQLDRIESSTEELMKITKDTNVKVSAIGNMVLGIGFEIDKLKKDLFSNRREQRAFMNKLDEEIESLPSGSQPSEKWYDQKPKTKIKAGLNLLVVKWEREYDVSNAKFPKTWKELKEIFLKE